MIKRYAAASSMIESDKTWSLMVHLHTNIISCSRGGLPCIAIHNATATDILHSLRKGRMRVLVKNSLVGDPGVDVTSLKKKQKTRKVQVRNDHFK